MMISRLTLTLGVALPLLATPVLAQPAPPPAPATDATPHVEAWVQKRIDGLHRRLKITPAEEPAFQAFANQMLGNAVTMHQVYETRRTAVETMTAPETLNSYADMIDAQAKEAHSLSAPFQALYAQLSPDQQKTADAIFQAQAEHMGHHKPG